MKPARVQCVSPWHLGSPGGDCPRGAAGLMLPGGPGAVRTARAIGGDRPRDMGHGMGDESLMYIWFIIQPITSIHQASL